MNKRKRWRIVLKWWKNFIKRLGESNRKEFGGKRLDCCNINRENSK
ncbi:LDCC motif putative metal-binding protein [Proteiniclasticum sp.]|nr:LDCC motif putative metal-binding protein [Proteiniclasticum sp.]